MKWLQYFMVVSLLYEVVIVLFAVVVLLYRDEKVQDLSYFLIEHWHMIYIMSVVFAEIYV